MPEAALSDRPVFDPARVAGLVLDLDGTLVDSYAAITASLNAARKRFGMAPLPEETVRRHVGRGLECLVAELVGADRVETAVAEFRRRYAEVFAEHTHALPGVTETLHELRRRGFRLAVASNKPARFGAPILAQLGLGGWIDVVEGPDTAGVTKPEPAMLRRCLAAMAVDPSRAVYVGDMALDVETADRAGVAVVLVPGGSCSATELRRTGRPVLRSFSELRDLLPERPAS